MGITFTPVSSVSPPAGAPIGARNGLSVDAAKFAVLGQSLLAVGDPGKLLSFREIPQAGFGLNIWGGGVEFSQIRRAVVSPGVGIHVDTTLVGNILRVGNTARDLFAFGADGTYSVNDINTGVIGIAMKSQRFANATLPAGGATAFSIVSNWSPNNTTDPALINDFLIGSRVVLPNVATDTYAAVNISPTIQQLAGAGGNIRGFWYHPSFIAGALANQHIGFEIESGDVLFNTGTSATQFGRVGMQGVFTPTAYLEIGPGTGAVGTGQIKLDAGTVLAVPEQGALEFDGVDLFFTRLATQENVLMGNATAAPATTGAPVFTSFYGGNTKAMGDPVGWLLVNIAGVARKIAFY